MLSRVKRTHANDLKLAEVDGRENPKINGEKRETRRVTLARPEDLETERDTEDDDGKPTIVG